MNPYYPHLFKPFKIKKVTFRNRIFAAPSMMSHMPYSGRADQSMVSYYAEKARGGAAVVTLGDTPVDREHAATNPRSFAITPENMPLLAEIALAIHEGGAVASHELNHGGRVATAECNFGDENWEAWGPSDEVRRGVKVHAMTPEEMDQVADSYAEKAEMLKRAGYDMCLIHGGHGWLLDQFLSPLYNTRTDEYGGSLENRARFPLMVIDRVRARCGEDFLIEYRLSGSEEIEGGLTKEESVRFARMIDGKVDIIHVSAGMDTEPEQAVRTHPTSFLPHGVNVHYAEAVKAAGVKSLVATIGGISDPEMAEEILASGKADIIAMSRALIADPFLPKKAAHGKSKEIIPCLRCLDCLGGLHQGRNLTCAVNCHTAQERRHRSVIRPAEEKKKVLVVGGGPGGLKAAETAARRGHQVTLAEASEELGGTLKFTDKDELKEDLKRLKDHLIYMAEQSGAEILLNTTVTPGFIREGGYDGVILAVGASPAKPPIPGLDSPGVLHALEVYDREGDLGKNVVMLGGGLVGCETALFLAHRGHSVTIVEMGSDTAADTHWMYKEGMRQAFLNQPITTLLNTKALKVESGRGVTVQGPDGEEFIPADSVVYALGMKPNEDLVNELQEVCIDTVPVGDCLNPRKARNAMEEGFWAVVNLG